MYYSSVGLEIHVQLATHSKVFCSCRANFGDEPNTNVCPVCLGYPGVLPTLNTAAIEIAYTVAHALNCQLAPECAFDRKNYFYPDLPKNYQITQFYRPVGTNGYLDLSLHQQSKRVRIREIHLEEDAGKMIHAGEVSLLDFNRAGTPLLEIVTEPDLEIGEEAEQLLLELRRIVRYLGVSDGNMEEGSLRCDANLSLSPSRETLGCKVEVKNLNSSRFVRKAITYEIERQREILTQGGEIRQETRLWNENRDQTEAMRSKEESHDYRYFPEPDLPPFRADEPFLSRAKDRVVELPAARRARLQGTWGLSPGQVAFLTEERETADYFEDTMNLPASTEISATEVHAWLAGDVRKELNRRACSLQESPFSPPRLAQLLSLIASREISGKIAKLVVHAVFEEDADPADIVVARNWHQITDRTALQDIIERVCVRHASVVEEISRGEDKALGYLIGRVMRETDGRADPTLTHELLSARVATRPEMYAVVPFGGAITGRVRDDGSIEPGGNAELRALVEAQNDIIPSKLHLDEGELVGFLSEEVTPADWAALIVRLTALSAHPSIKGIVVTHGTDTLSYSAALLHWFFATTTTPIVLTASTTAPPHKQADQHFREALSLAQNDTTKGVMVTFGSTSYPALNLRFEGLERGYARFRTWNALPQWNTSLLTEQTRQLPLSHLRAYMEWSIRHTPIVRVYPAMPSSVLEALIEEGRHAIVMETFDSGTVGLRASPFSLAEALSQARESGGSGVLHQPTGGSGSLSRIHHRPRPMASGSNPDGSTDHRKCLDKANRVSGGTVRAPGVVGNIP